MFFFADLLSFVYGLTRELQRIENIFYLFYWWDLLHLLGFLLNQDNLHKMHYDSHLFYDIYIHFLQMFLIFFFFHIYIKISKNIWAKYYQKNKERLQKKAHERYQNLSTKEQEQKWQYYRKCYKQFSEDEKQKLVEY